MTPSPHLGRRRRRRGTTALVAGVAAATASSAAAVADGASAAEAFAGSGGSSQALSGGGPATAAVASALHTNNKHHQQRRRRELQRNKNRVKNNNENNVDSPQQQEWFPNWSGGTNECLLACPDSSSSPNSLSQQLASSLSQNGGSVGGGDGGGEGGCHVRPSYIARQESIVKSSMEECCDGYYFWDLENCMKSGAADGEEVANDPAQEDEGTLQWYADFASFRCVQDCPASGVVASTSTDQCGGLISVVDPDFDEDEDLHSTAAECCASEFPYLAGGACEASSMGRDYWGSKLYYVDYVNGRCVQDCYDPDDGSISTNEGICGGIIHESSTRLFDDVSTCCSEQLSYIDSLLCETRSDKERSGEGTFRLYPHLDTGTCVIDHDPSNAIVCGIGYECRLLPLTSWVSDLHPVSPAGVEECCSDESLSRTVDPTYCKSRTMGVLSRRWYVDYARGMCHQDCKEDPGSPSCKESDDSGATYHESAEICCSEKLGYLNQAKCVADSTHTEYLGSNKFYADYSRSKCVKDCPLTDGGECRGVVQNSGTVLYDDVLGCCQNSLRYMDEGLCVDRSDSDGTGTGRYYPSEEDSICVKDTSLTCPTGETCRRVNGWVATLYDTPSQCCQGESRRVKGPLQNVDVEYCQAFSTSTPTGKWFRMEGNRCARHCSSDGIGAAGAECDVPTDSSSSHHDTARECCQSELSHINVDTCTELSEKGGILSDLRGTEQFYVDWIYQACVKNCPEGSGPDCGGLAGGSWVKLYDDVDLCCDNLHYIERGDCVRSDVGSR